MRSILPESDLEEVVLRARPSFEHLRGARLFITGGTGFWGTWLLETFARANAELRLDAEAVVLTRDATRGSELEGVSFVSGDVRSFTTPGGSFTHILHCATASGSPVGPAETIDTIVEGTRRVLALAREKAIPRMLYASSGAVYGRQPTTLTHLPEDHPGAPDPLEPGSAYGNAKRLAEQLCTLPGGPECVIARGFAFVGPLLPLDGHFAIGNFLRDALAGHEIVVRGDGTPFRSWLYASDLATWLWTILVRGAPGRAWNVGSEEAVQIGALARMIGAEYGVPVSVLGKSSAGSLPERYVPSTRRAREELGLEARVPLAESIRRTGEWVARAGKPAGARTAGRKK